MFNSYLFKTDQIKIWKEIKMIFFVIIPSFILFCNCDPASEAYEINLKSRSSDWKYFGFKTFSRRLKVFFSWKELWRAWDKL
jgi:hypothetical protein